MQKKGLLERFADGDSIICAEGYLLEFERRGYMQAGGFFPEVVLDHPEIVRQLHEEFTHAGSDVVVAFTGKGENEEYRPMFVYAFTRWVIHVTFGKRPHGKIVRFKFYGHRKKMRDLGREADVERLNREALRIAKEVADRHGCLLAGNICNSGLYLPDDYTKVKEMFEEQVRWAKEGHVDFIIAESFKALGEAFLALEACKKGDIRAVVTLSAHTSETTFDGTYIPDACKQLEDSGAAVVGLNCGRGPTQILPLVKETVNQCRGPVAALPVAYRTTDEIKAWEGLKNPDTGKNCYPQDIMCHQCTRTEIREFAENAKQAGVRYIGLCCGNSSNFVRELAEVYGRKPPASKYRPDVGQSLYFADESTLSENTIRMSRHILGE